MPWTYQKEGRSTTGQEERQLRIFFAVLFTFVAIAALITAAREFSDGESWDGARHLVMALLCGLLAAKGPQLRSSGTAGVRLLVIGAFLVYLVLWIFHVVVPLTR